jgi:hypothetical protein
MRTNIPPLPPPREREEQNNVTPSEPISVERLSTANANTMTITELMNADNSNFQIRWTKRLIRCSVLLDVFIWFFGVICLSSVVSDSLANPRSEFHLASQIRAMTIDEGGFSDIKDITSMLKWIEESAISKLVPLTSSSMMRSTYLHKIKEVEDNKHIGVNSINGVLRVLGDRIIVRQIRVPNPYDSCALGQCDGRSPPDIASFSDNTWIYNIEQPASTVAKTNSSSNRRLIKAKVKINSGSGVPTSSSSSTGSTTSSTSDTTYNPAFCYGSAKDSVQFWSETLSSNTKSKANFQNEYGGYGYVQIIDTSLYSTSTGEVITQPNATSSSELGDCVAEYNDGLRQSHECAVVFGKNADWLVAVLSCCSFVPSVLVCEASVFYSNT